MEDRCRYRAERQACADFDQISRDVTEEMLATNGTRLAALGELNDQVGRAWAADPAVLDDIIGNDAERT